jgi:hypothetical protein
MTRYNVHGRRPRRSDGPPNPTLGTDRPVSFCPFCRSPTEPLPGAKKIRSRILRRPGVSESARASNVVGRTWIRVPDPDQETNGSRSDNGLVAGRLSAPAYLSTKPDTASRAGDHRQTTPVTTPGRDRQDGAAPSGRPWAGCSLSRSSRVSQDLRSPCATTSTLPSRRFVADPTRPSSSARDRTHHRKPTCWTCPRTQAVIRTRSVPEASVESSAITLPRVEPGGGNTRTTTGRTPGTHHREDPTFRNHPGRSSLASGTVRYASSRGARSKDTI